jgi:hypothetical protein
MVSETSVDDKLFVSEKSFKPLAHRHPFMIYGTPGTLKHLRELGFQTFDHVIDETYDSEPNELVDKLNRHKDPIRSMNRLTKISQNLDRLYEQFCRDPHLFTDAESLCRLDHNYHWFYNSALIAQHWKTEVVDVIEEFVAL